MANTKSIKKIETILKKHKQTMSISELSEKAHLQRKTVREVVELLDKYGQVEVMSSSKITLVKLR